MVTLFMWGCSRQENTTVNLEKPAAIPEQAFILTENGLKYAEIQMGSGIAAEAGDLVMVQYTGWLTDGKRFDSSLLRKEPFEFNLGYGNVIAGWEEGIAGMKAGGIRQLIIPPALGYGERGAAGVIPPNATLVFEVQLVEVKKRR